MDSIDAVDPVIHTGTITAVFKNQIDWVRARVCAID